MADNKLKFLDIVGLTQLVSEIKTRINTAVTTATNKTLINAVEFTNADGKITFKQGTDNSNVKDVTLGFATNAQNGLMTKEQVTALDNLKTDKLDKVALRIDGTDHASLFTTTTVNGKQVAVIDYTTKLSSLTDAQKIQAPTAEAVATALGTKVNTEAYNTKVAALEKSITDNKNAADQALATKVDSTDYATDKAAINKTITDGLALKLDSSTYTTDKQEQTLKDQTQDTAIANLEKMLNTTGTTATNVYNKTEVNNAIAGVKAEILGGDITQALKDYDTIKEIAEWITNDETGAANLASTVATLKSTTEGHATAIEGLQSDVDTIFGTDGKGGLIGGLDTRLDTVENDLNTATTGIKARLTAAETNITNLKSELDTAGTGIKARLTTAENDIDKLQLDYQTINSDINGTAGLKATKADKTAAIGSVETVEGTNAYDLVFTSVSGDKELGRVSFQVFTAAEITALFA